MSRTRASEPRRAPRRISPVAVAALGGAAAAYALLVGRLASLRELGNDELFTYYFSRLNGLDDVWRQLEMGVEQTPPFFYVLTRASLRLFGDNDVGLRLPALAGVLLAAACILVLVARRSTIVHGALAALLLMATQATFYAHEARPYGIVLGLVALCALLWQLRLEGGGAFVVILLAITAAAAVATHYYAVLALLPLAAGEAARAIGRGRVDLPLVVAGACALVPLFLAAPLIQAARGYSGSFWTEFSWRSAVEFNAWLFSTSAMPQGLAFLRELSLLVWVGCALALHVLVFPTTRPSRWRRLAANGLLSLLAVGIAGVAALRAASGATLSTSAALAAAGAALVAHTAFSARYGAELARRAAASQLTRPEVVVAAGFVLVPLAAVALAELVTGAYTPRYVLPAGLGVAWLLPLAVHRLEGSRRLLSVALAVALVLAVGRDYWVQTVESRDESRAQASMIASLEIVAARSDLSIAVVDPLRFFELSHYAPASVAERIFHLSDHDAALRYTGTASTEDGLVILSRFAPLDVRPFDRYVGSGNRFLLLLDLGSSNWVAPALEDAGRAMRPYPNSEGLPLHLVL